MPATAPSRQTQWLAGLLVVALAAAGGVIFYQRRILDEQERRLAERDRRNTELAEELRAARSASGVTQPAPAAPGAGPAAGGRRSRDEAPSAAAENELQPLRESLAQANNTVARLEGRIAELEVQLEKTTAENQRIAGTETELKQNLAEASRTVQSVENEMKTQSSRLAELEAANQRLRQESAQGSRSSSQLLQVASELQDINRRRENYLNSILRRYKDLTEQYRALSGALDSRRERQAPLSESEMGRIQNTIAMTEEDLRQINSLNAQAVSIQKKLPQK